MEKIDRPEKKSGKDVMSSSYENWTYRLKTPETFTQHVNERPKSTKEDY